MKLGKSYDIIKWVAIVGLPALTALWLAVGVIWAIPLTNEIGATMAAIDTFLGALVGVSNINHKKSQQVDSESYVGGTEV